MVNDDRLARLKAKLVASERMGAGYTDRIEAIKREITRMENRDVSAD